MAKALQQEIVISTEAQRSELNWIPGHRFEAFTGMRTKRYLLYVDRFIANCYLFHR